MSHEIRRSAIFPIVAAAIPRIRAIDVLPIAPINPTPILNESPIIVRVNISLPNQSVPNKCSKDGGKFRALKFVAILSYQVKHRLLQHSVRKLLRL